MRMKHCLSIDVPTGPLWKALIRAHKLMAVFILMMSAVAGARAEQGDQEAPIELKFITIDVAPWAYRASDSEETLGAFVDIVQALERETGYSIRKTLTPFARVDRELETGDHDCTILVPRSEQIVKHGSIITDHDIGIVSRADNPIGEYADLEGQRISLLRGSSISERFDADDAFEREYDTDYLIALRKLSRERVNAIAGAIPTILHLAEENGLSGILAPTLKLADIPLMFQCSRNSPHLELMPALSAAIETLRASGELDAIVEKYHF